ncbi:hypothetical protein LB504_004008 [Fusarium proliferatum]|nr:hypothetical protein LB504_004008 [Fusarium proliferatum]
MAVRDRPVLSDVLHSQITDILKAWWDWSQSNRVLQVSPPNPVEEPNRCESHCNALGGCRQDRLLWMHPSLYAVEKTLFPGTDQAPDAPLLVDVARGLGHDIHEFKKFYPEHPGMSFTFTIRTTTTDRPPKKLILQDLPVVINDVKDIDPSIELMPHDFLTE